ALRVIKKNRFEREDKRPSELESAQKIAEQLASISCTINAKTGDSDKLYGSITNSDIAEALKANGISVDKKKIILDDPIRELGVFDAKVRLHPDVIASFKVWIVEE
ncbi:MAG: 50S ribosomal protein L9, partial [Lentisphaerae bacterium]|nr:50S ribosomal protein L9 [Lentisphaerota bacterium]